MNTDTQLGGQLIEGKSKLVNRPRMSKGKQYDSYFVYIPTEVMRDSQFPFKHGDEVVVRIDTANKRLLIEKAPEEPGKEENQQGQG